MDVNDHMRTIQFHHDFLDRGLLLTTDMFRV